MVQKIYSVTKSNRSPSFYVKVPKGLVVFMASEFLDEILLLKVHS